MTTLEERIRRLEDRAELHDLVATYFRATDDDDYQSLGDCFTSDAIFSASGFPACSGRDDITEVLKSARAGMGQTVHTPSYLQLVFEGDNAATGMVAAHLELGIGEATYYAAVRYFDRYRRENGRWQILKREMRAIHVGPWSEVASSLSEPLNIRWPGGPPQASDFPRHDSTQGASPTATAGVPFAENNN